MDLRQLIIFDDFFFHDKRKISRILEFRGFDPHTVPNFEILEKPVLNEYQWSSQVRETGERFGTRCVFARRRRRDAIQGRRETRTI